MGDSPWIGWLVDELTYVQRACRRARCANSLDDMMLAAHVCQ
jgi:hypothetical protein